MAAIVPRLYLYNLTSGTLIGYTTNVRIASVTSALDAVGQISVGILATDPLAVLFDDNAAGRCLARLYFDSSGTFVTQWVVRNVKRKIVEGEWLVTEDTNDLFDEWTRASTLHSLMNELTLAQIFKDGAVGVNADGTGAQIWNLQGLLTAPPSITGLGISLGYTLSIPSVLVAQPFTVESNYDTRLRAILKVMERVGGLHLSGDTLPDGYRGHWYAHPRTRVFYLGQVGAVSGLTLQGGQGLAIGDPAQSSTSRGWIESIEVESIQDELANRLYLLGGRTDSGLPERQGNITALVRILGVPHLALQISDSEGGIYKTVDEENFVYMSSATATASLRPKSALLDKGIHCLEYAGDVGGSTSGDLYAGTSFGVFKLPSSAVGATPAWTKLGTANKYRTLHLRLQGTTLWAACGATDSAGAGLWAYTNPNVSAGDWGQVDTLSNIQNIPDIMPISDTRCLYIDGAVNKLYKMEYTGGAWTQVQLGAGTLTGNLTSLWRTPTYIYIATDDGLYRYATASEAISSGDITGNLTSTAYGVNGVTYYTDTSGTFYYALTSTGLYKSSDGQTAWTSTSPAGTGSFAAVFVTQAADVWFATDRQKLYRSNTGGAVWTDMTQSRVSLAFEFGKGTITYGSPPTTPDVSTYTGWPYDIKRTYDPKNDWVYYIEDTTSQGTYGVVEANEQAEDLATSIYLHSDVASQYLRIAGSSVLLRRKDRLLHYIVQASYADTAHLLHTINPGDTLVVNGTWIGGAVTALTLSNVTLYLIEIVREVQPDSTVSCTLTLGTTPNAKIPTLSDVVANLAWSAKNYRLGV